MIKQPASTCYGHLYEHQAIKEWVAAKGKCPLTQKPLRPNQIFPQYSVKAAIVEMRKVAKELEDQKAELARLKAGGEDNAEEEKKEEPKADEGQDAGAYNPFDANKETVEEA